MDYIWTKNNQQFSKITKKRKEKVLVEHWLMHKEEKKTVTELSKCKGCEIRSERTTDSCEKQIRRNHDIKAIPELLVKKNNNKINAILEQLLENRTIEEQKKEEENLVELRQIEELEIELIKKQRLNETIMNQLIEILTRNKRKDKEKYICYTDGALYKGKEKGKSRVGKMGISWVQVGDRKDWPEEEVALRLERWASSTIAELAAIWAAILTVPEKKNIEVYTDSIATLRNISRAVQDMEEEKIIKKKM